MTAKPIGPDPAAAAVPPLQPAAQPPLVPAVAWVQRTSLLSQVALQGLNDLAALRAEALRRTQTELRDIAETAPPGDLAALVAMSQRATAWTLHSLAEQATAELRLAQEIFDRAARVVAATYGHAPEKSNAPDR